MSEQNTALVTASGSNLPASAADIKRQVNLIQEVMRDVMKDDVHFGKVPGCGDKPVLLKAGAEKLCLTFRLAVSFDSDYIDMPNGHRTYTTKARLITPSGQIVGEGIGVCSTMETKYRFRGQQVTFTDRPVPREYWDLRRDNPKEAQKSLGGPGFVAKKNENGMWMIAEQTGEKMEHDNPADYYNTCAKISKKRAHVDVTITTLAASDIFEQDIDEAETGDEVPVQGKKDSKPRPGKEAVAKQSANLTDEQKEHRNKLIADLSAVADEGWDRLQETWQKMSEADRTLVGADFGRIKKLAETADKGGAA
jgi:hypothetical protein